MFSGAPMYATYTDPAAWAEAMKLCVPLDLLEEIPLSGPEMFNTLPPLEDQQLGAVLMKIIQEAVYGIYLAVIFFSGSERNGKKIRCQSRRISSIPSHKKSTAEYAVLFYYICTVFNDSSNSSSKALLSAMTCSEILQRCRILRRADNNAFLKRGLQLNHGPSAADIALFCRSLNPQIKCPLRY